LSNRIFAQSKYSYNQIVIKPSIFCFMSNLKLTLTLHLSLLMSIGVTNAQTSLIMGSSGGPAGNGPVSTPQVVTLTDASSGSLSTTTVTYSLVQQFGPGAVEGLPTNSGMIFGATGNIASNAITPNPFYPLMNSIGSPTNAMFTSCVACAVGTGLNVGTDKMISLYNTSDALIPSTTTPFLYPLNARVYYGDLTITFNKPVSNPVLQFVGMGGSTSFTSAVGNKYDMGFATEFDLLSTNVTLSRLSGSTAFALSANKITNSATYLGANSGGASSNGITRYGASGTVVALGTNITSVTFKVYLRGDGGRINNTVNVVPAEVIGGVTQSPYWSLGASNSFGINSSNFSGDLMLFGVSLQKPVTISGNVFNDPTAGNVDNSTGVANLVPSTLFANLIDANGKVVKTTAVATSGAYSFTDVFEGSFTVSLSTTAGTQNTTKPAETLPTGWGNTGEFTGAPNTGSDAIVNGITAAFTVAATAITNINFAIEQLPIPTNNAIASQLNPGTTVMVPVPATMFTATDPDGTVTSIRITEFPSNANSITINGTNYISSTFPLNGVTVPTNLNGNPTQAISIDPIDGTTMVGIPYRAIDNAGKESSTIGTANLPFTGPPTYSISGTVFNDAGGLSDATVNGTTATIPTGLRANLLNASGAVVQSVPIAANGTYTFPSVAQNTTYTVIIAASPTATTPALPPNWVNTGENIGTGAGSDSTPNGSITVAVATSNVTDVNFGLDQRPTANTATAAIQTNPNGIVDVTVPSTVFTSTDPENTVTSITFTVFPTGATSVTINGTTYLANNPADVTALTSLVIPTNTSGNPTVPILVDPTANGITSVVFSFKTTDSAGVISSNTGSATQPLNGCTGEANAGVITRL
jgi:hypothetical protein